MMETAIERREAALRQIKAIHTNWYMGRCGAYDALAEIERVVVSVWQADADDLAATPYVPPSQPSRNRPKLTA